MIKVNVNICADKDGKEKEKHVCFIEYQKWCRFGFSSVLYMVMLRIDSKEEQVSGVGNDWICKSEFK